MPLLRKSSGANGMTAEGFPDLPGWALKIPSPYMQQKNTGSWFGGEPHAPPQFEWPRDADGAPMHFLLQINLDTLAQMDGATPPDLPRDGALLIFIGKHYATDIFSSDEMAEARPVASPDDLGKLRDRGFSGIGPDRASQRSFPHWALDPVSLTTGEETHDVRIPFANPEDWIDTWGLAAQEVQNALEALDKALNHGRYLIKADIENAEYNRNNPPDERARQFRDAKRAYHEFLEIRGAKLTKLLSNWRDRATTESPTGPTDRETVSDHFQLREKLLPDIDQHTNNLTLRGNADKIQKMIRESYPAVGEDGKPPPQFDGLLDFDAVPSAYQGFVEKLMTVWRGHRLFGRRPVMPNAIPVNRDGGSVGAIDDHECLFHIPNAMLFGGCTDHYDGVSILCPKRDIRAGRLDGGKVVYYFSMN